VRIGDVAARTGASVRSLRYYEQQGLVESTRTSGGQRDYADETVDRVRLVQHFYAAGLSSRTIRGILPSVDAGRATEDALELLVRERDRIAATIDDLTATLGRLSTVIGHAESSSPDLCAAHSTTALDAAPRRPLRSGPRASRSA
jgi:DNA-binding transcriptional MerR regulator